ncbi:hypothetical protein PaG_00946 [Moesziomyces aphidis]|jgi:hypothetical protein|uniref:Uncharacterized protein n=1 Tax=Moesziomyces aphidis TaxID=84754 RepID=W3VSF8_MOEAP|nr:hypothetical protein PaG_00946 [Moesziomyces aphidis]
MFFKTLCIFFVAPLISSVVAGNAMGRFATDDNQVGRYCNRNNPPQGRFVCFQYNGNIRDGMTSTDASMHGYVNSAGTSKSKSLNTVALWVVCADRRASVGFVVMFDGPTEAFSTGRMDVVISNSNPCLEVSTLDSGGDSREYQGCSYSPPIWVY